MFAEMYLLKLVNKLTNVQVHELGNKRKAKIQL